MLSHRPLLNPSSSDATELSLAHTPPEINLIPFIDVLLVVLIFLMVSTTFTQYQQLSINLPTAQGSTAASPPNEIKIAVSKDGRYTVGGILIDANQLGPKIQQIAQTWANQKGLAAPDASLRNTSSSLEARPELGRIVVSADAKASHQSVMLVLELASQANIKQVVFATQDASKAKLNKR